MSVADLTETPLFWREVKAKRTHCRGRWTPSCCHVPFLRLNKDNFHHLRQLCSLWCTAKNVPVKSKAIFWQCTLFTRRQRHIIGEGSNDFLSIYYTIPTTHACYSHAYFMSNTLCPESLSAEDSPSKFHWIPLWTSMQFLVVLQQTTWGYENRRFFSLSLWLNRVQWPNNFSIFPPNFSKKTASKKPVAKYWSKQRMTTLAVSKMVKIQRFFPITIWNKSIFFLVSFSSNEFDLHFVGGERDRPVFFAREVLCWWKHCEYSSTFPPPPTHFFLLQHSDCETKKKEDIDLHWMASYCRSFLCRIPPFFSSKWVIAISSFMHFNFGATLICWQKSW